MRHLDKFEQVAADCIVGAVILGNVHNGDFQLWPFGKDIPADVDRRFRVRGLCFLGVMGLPTFDSPSGNVALANPLPKDMIQAITAEFDRIFGIAVELMGDSIPWLERLHSLPDGRGPYEA